VYVHIYMDLYTYIPIFAANICVYLYRYLHTNMDV
jgi:hypothetical protein